MVQLHSLIVNNPQHHQSLIQTVRGIVSQLALTWSHGLVSVVPLNWTVYWYTVLRRYLMEHSLEVSHSISLWKYCNMNWSYHLSDSCYFLSLSYAWRSSFSLQVNIPLSNSCSDRVYDHSVTASFFCTLWITKNWCRTVDHIYNLGETLKPVQLFSNKWLVPLWPSAMTVPIMRLPWHKGTQSGSVLYYFL